MINGTLRGAVLLRLSQLNNDLPLFWYCDGQDDLCIGFLSFGDGSYPGMLNSG